MEIAILPKRRGRPAGSRNEPCSVEKKPYICVTCKQRYKTQPGLKYHITHAHAPLGLRLNSCPVCLKAFSTPERLNQHSRQHDVNLEASREDRPLRCPNPGCTKSFKTAGGLQYHEKTAHVLARPFLHCPSLACRKIFTSSAGLAHHLQKHESHRHGPDGLTLASLVGADELGLSLGEDAVDVSLLVEPLSAEDLSGLV